MTRFLTAVGSVIAALALALPVNAQVTGSASGSGIQTWQAQGTQIAITDAGFQPSQLTIAVNDVVTFINKGTSVHSAVTATGISPTFDTGGLAPGQWASFQFSVPGSFPYQSNTEGDKTITNNNSLVSVTYKLEGTITVQTAPVASTVPAPAAAAPAPAAAPCQFILGFSTLAGALPQQVGKCVDDQASAPNGDALQHTSGGLLVWRKSDNWTAFTDGYHTWVNGPNGIQERLNTARFPWEH
jgi:plastocyanin